VAVLVDEEVPDEDGDEELPTEEAAA